MSLARQSAAFAVVLKVTATDMQRALEVSGIYGPRNENAEGSLMRQALLDGLTGSNAVTNGITATREWFRFLNKA